MGRRLGIGYLGGGMTVGRGKVGFWGEVGPGDAVVPCLDLQISLANVTPPALREGDKCATVTLELAVGGCQCVSHLSDPIRVMAVSQVSSQQSQVCTFSVALHYQNL
jgi:hypothetical protein